MSFQGDWSIWNRIITVHLNECQQIPVSLGQICTHGWNHMTDVILEEYFFSPVCVGGCVGVFRIIIYDNL